jgi:vancomycin aglycone glucosyltransferase
MMQNPDQAKSQAADYVVQVWEDKSTTLKSVANGADLLLAGITEQRLAANIAEYYGIPLAGLHFFPAEILESSGPRGLATTGPERAQRQALGLPEATGRAVDRVALEIQAYDELCFPALAAQWTHADVRRPFVGALTLELPTDTDDASCRGSPRERRRSTSVLAARRSHPPTDTGLISRSGHLPSNA